VKFCTKTNRKSSTITLNTEATNFKHAENTDLIIHTPYKQVLEICILGELVLSSNWYNFNS
jgi:hypothetical protein